MAHCQQPALIGAAYGQGVFANDFVQTHMLNFWLYAMTLSTVGLSMALSIAQRRQVEARLSQSQAFKEAILNFVAAEVAVIDREGVILAVNQRWYQFAEGNTAVQSILITKLDGFRHTDLQGCLLDVNPSYCQMSGYTRDELLTLCVSDLEAVGSQADTALRRNAEPFA